MRLNTEKNIGKMTTYAEAAEFNSLDEIFEDVFANRIILND